MSPHVALAKGPRALPVGLHDLCLPASKGYERMTQIRNALKIKKNLCHQETVKYFFALLKIAKFPFLCYLNIFKNKGFLVFVQ
jgi:hypothetical protein